ncbi:MAG: winged helix-turn-helix transcriptional regulator [Alphaproteobacteria bacterium]
MRWSELGDSACTLARALSAIGDRWSLVLLREAFFGVRRWEDFQRQTGASPKIVADRLGKLVGHGILERRPYSERPPRDEYRLTAKGRDLYPVLMAVSQWGQRWMGDPERPPVVHVHRGCGRPMRPVMVCDACGEPVRAADVAIDIDPAYAAERARRAAG